MRPKSRIGIGGIGLVATTLALHGCGGGSNSRDARSTAASPPPPPPRTVVGHRVGPARVEPGRQALPASPCYEFARNGKTAVHLFSDAPHCTRVAPGERLLFVNDTGIGPQHSGATTVWVRVGDYELRIRPGGSGLIPAPVETYLGRGSHLVRTAGARGATILLLPRVCAVRPPAAPGEELCFR
jgi:hypothetical protein